MKVGDVISFKKGAVVVGLLEQKYMYYNCPLEDNKSKANIAVGKTYTLDSERISRQIEVLKLSMIKELENIGKKVSDIEREKIDKLYSELIDLSSIPSLLQKCPIYPEDEFVVKHIDKEKYGFTTCSMLKDGKYDNEGYMVTFYLDKNFDYDYLPPKDYEIVGKMEMGFVRIK